MAIVLKYGPPGSILQSGFAAGIGQRQKEQQKNLLGLWQQQQTQAFQGQQAYLARQQQAGLQQNAQNFQAHQQILGRRFQSQQADLTRQQQQKHYDDLRYQTTMKGLANGDLELPGSAQMELKKLDEGRVLVQGPGWTDQDRAQFEKDYQERKRALTMLASPVTSPAAAANRDTVHRDKTGKAYDQPVEGVTSPYSLSSSKPIEYPQAQAAQKAAEVQAKQQEKVRAAQQKQQEKLRADQQKQAEKAQTAAEARAKNIMTHAEHLHKTQAEPTTEELAKGVTRKPLKDFIEEATANIDAASKAAGIVPPQQAAPTAAPPEQIPQVHMTQGQGGDGQHGEPVTGDISASQQAQPNGTFSGLPAVNQPFTGSTAGGPSEIPKTPAELGLYQREQAAKARAMGIRGSSAVEDPRETGEGSEYADQSGKKYKMINGTWKRIQ